jgi:hypothetical protein
MDGDPLRGDGVLQSCSSPRPLALRARASRTASRTTENAAPVPDEHTERTLSPAVPNRSVEVTRTGCGPEASGLGTRTGPGPGEGVIVGEDARDGEGGWCGNVVGEMVVPGPPGPPQGSRRWIAPTAAQALRRSVHSSLRRHRRTGRSKNARPSGSRKVLPGPPSPRGCFGDLRQVVLRIDVLLWVRR